MKRPLPMRREPKPGNSADDGHHQLPSSDPSTIPQIAGNSVGPRVKGKVVIITGLKSLIFEAKAQMFQEPTVRWESGGQLHINSPTTALGPFISATMPPTISSPTKPSCASSIPAWIFAPDSSTLLMRRPSKRWSTMPSRSMVVWI